MDDKSIMENILLTTKGACDLYMHGAIESGAGNVHNAFNQSLNETLAIQDNVYQTMTSRGWYGSQQADQSQRQQVRQKFASK